MPNHLVLDISSKTVRPGESVAGEFLWDLESKPKSVNLSLGWWTSGRGDRDEAVIASETWDDPSTIGKETFSFSLPPSVIPSFSGKLISVQWGLQLSVKGIRLEDVIEELVVSPLMREIDISKQSYESKGKSFSFGKSRRFPLSNRS